jgi:3-phosphoshikimate 1-carboxyvinyltransferase
MKQSLTPIAHPVICDVSLPGSKSMCNRALLIAAMAEGTTKLTNMLFSDDVEACIEALGVLGVQLEVYREDRQIIVQGCNGEFPHKQVRLYTREAGTLTRFLIPLCAAQRHGLFHFSASERMMERPLSELMEVLEAQGCEVEYLDKHGYMPFNLKPQGLRGGSASICGKKSSQFLSGLLLASPFAKLDLSLVSETDHQQPYVKMTVAMMTRFGVVVTEKHNSYVAVSGQNYKGRDYSIEPDLSTASYFWALAAITKGKVCVRHTTSESHQGDIRFVGLLEEMGCQVDYTDQGIIVTGGKSLKGISVNMRNFSDTFMTAAAVAVFAKGETFIEGLSHTRLQESDRVVAMSAGLQRLGVTVETTEDSIKILPNLAALHGAEVLSHNDHRIAMSLALLGLKVSDVVIDGAECVKKTCPDYFERMAKVLNSAGMIEALR